MEETYARYEQLRDCIFDERDERMNARADFFELLCRQQDHLRLTRLGDTPTDRYNRYCHFCDREFALADSKIAKLRRIMEEQLKDIMTLTH